MALQVEIVSSTGQLWKGEAGYVGLMTCGGSIGILSGHQPMLATVVAGNVAIHTLDGEKLNVAVGAGMLSVDDDNVVIVVEEPEVQN